MRLALISFLFVSLCACNSALVGNASFLTDNARETQKIQAQLRLPSGAGPHPAVILMHGCGGLELEEPGQNVWRALNSHANALLEAGIATLIVDSWGSRGEFFNQLVPTGCKKGRFSTRVNDLYGALAYLDGVPEIDATRVGAIGMSEGGHAVLRALETDNYRSRKHRLRASAGLYPACHGTSPPYYAPTLILIGDADDITLAAACENVLYMANLQPEGNQWSGDMPVFIPELVVYPGVHHSFDLPLRGLQRMPLGTVAPSRGATLDARSRMVTFFRNHLFP